MRGWSRRMDRGAWIAALVVALLLAGCLGSEEAPDDPGAGSDHTVRETIEEQELDFQGSARLGVASSATGARSWMLGSEDGFVHEADFPKSFENGTLRFDWSGGYVAGGLVLQVEDADAETIHVFEVDGHSLREDLGADDERLDNAARIAVLPGGGVPITFIQEARWALEFNFLLTHEITETTTANP